MLNTSFMLYKPINYNPKCNQAKNNNPSSLAMTNSFNAKRDSLSFGSNNGFYNLNAEYVSENGELTQPPSLSKIKEKVATLDINALWQWLNKENEQKQYIKLREKPVDDSFLRTTLEQYEIYKTSPEAKIILEKLDNMSQWEKADFVQLFCKSTGFPSLEAATNKMENEIQTKVQKLADDKNAAVKFIGYDSNCSMGRKCALPGKDCDGLFIIIEPPKDAPDWFAGCMRWNLKDVINQRIVSTPSNHLPEVLTTDYIEQGLDMASALFEEANFSQQDLARFLNNITDDSKDFVKTAEFDIELAKKLPTDTATRDKFYKTAMFVELVRDGKILENQFSPEFMDKIKSSPLYEYSNIMKQQSFKDLKKQKHILRENLVEQFKQGTTEEQYQIIRDILRSSLGMNDTQNEQCFTNESKDGADEMSNIVQMYDMLMNAVE